MTTACVARPRQRDDSTTTRSAAARTDTAPRPQLADVFRRYATRYRRQYGHRLTQQQDRALREIEVCRTPVLGGHERRCDTCGHVEQAFNTCRNRHCPQCSGYQRRKWYQDRLPEMLPVEYQHIVFTLPETLSELAHHNGPLIYQLLFAAASPALLHVGRTWTCLQAELGFIAVLHTWGQALFLHVHLHILWPAGGLSLDGTGWRSLPRGFCLPKDWLRNEFRKRFLDGLQQAYDQGELILRDRHGYLLVPGNFTRWMARLRTCYWNLDAQPVDLGREGMTPREAALCTLKYLAAYANGVALHNDRLISIEEDEVTFSYKDYRDQGRRKIARVPALEFIDRFLLHVLPRQLR
ncbi:MAG: transposase, partial [Acidobacteriota bacterium]